MRLDRDADGTHGRMAKRSVTALSEYVIAGPDTKRPGYGTWMGLNTAVKDPRALPTGGTYDSLNWVTGRYGDHIELRRGQARLGTTERTGSSRVTGLGIGLKSDGTQVPFFTADRSIFYYDSTTDDTIEVSTANILPSAANGEDVNIMPYNNLAGSFVYLTSPNSSIYKIPVANPATVADQNSTTYRFGFAKVAQNRMFGLRRQGKEAYSFDPTGVYMSYIDHQQVSDYVSAGMTYQTNEKILSGDGTTKTFTGTSLAIPLATPRDTVFQISIGAPIAAGKTYSAITKAANAKITSTAHGFSVGDAVMILGETGMTGIVGYITTVVTVVDSNNFTVGIDSTSFGIANNDGHVYSIEVFYDDTNGNLNSSAGGTGTINYASGAWSVTFNTAPISGTNNGIANYYYEDSKNNGICDFSFSATRTAGQGNVLSQFTNGKAEAIWPLQNIEYVFHVYNVWAVTIDSTNDLTQTNEPYRETFGAPYSRAVFPSPDGILLLNNAISAQPQFSILQIPQGSPNTTVVPSVLSLDLDLSSFGFDQAVVFRWGEWDFLSCKRTINGSVESKNGATFIRNIYSGIWNYLDYEVSCLAEYGGTLLSGDSLSKNLYTLFSGLDDDGSTISNYWKTAYTNFGMNGQKVANRMYIEGLIDRSQQVEVYVSLDQGDYVKVFTIDGTGNYVSQASPVGVGASTIGGSVVGGQSGTLFSNPFKVDFGIFTDEFEDISVQFRAINVGWAQIDMCAFRDIRLRRRTLPPYNTVQVS